ncbi:uncharacterized protein GGS25DRAFT_521226 [Hypoxylon fragiforme]|uniref:uncharacterized protein n=1 Tax=Hypoxylon fragiforme TaxID=63214 RepID=UPI0020C72601|nr:uncharacterized protein GGS25DRAFT_521226 [Hypoxylon fragiforme]KAI2608058.1 hypothetical protein GGS25DRAFT_521226 [Hypoxylon fragiforme]
MNVEHLAEAGEPFSHVRGYQDDNIACRLTVIRLVARFCEELDEGEEIELATRVYTQLTLEDSPLVDPSYEADGSLLSDDVFKQLHRIMKDQLGASYKLAPRKTI